MGDTNLEHLATQASIMLKDRLFRNHPTTRPMDLDFERNHHNRMTYHAVPDDGAYNWYGMDLQVVESSQARTEMPANAQRRSRKALVGK